MFTNHEHGNTKKQQQTLMITTGILKESQHAAFSGLKQMEDLIMRKFMPLLIIGLLFMPLLPLVSGEDEAFMVIVTKAEKDYEVGDTVDFTIHVFLEAEYVKADMVNITLNPYSNTTRYLDFTNESTGRYKVSFTIGRDDVVGGYVWGKVDVEYGELSASEYIDIAVYHLEVRSTISNPMPSKGDTVEITSIVTNKSVNYDPDEVKFYLYKDDERYQWNATGEELQTTKASTGVYKTSYTINPQDNESHVYEFETKAIDGDEEEFAWVEATLKYYQVWYNSSTCEETTESYEINETTFWRWENQTFCLFVADMEGKAVSGAEITVMMRYHYYNYSRESSHSRPSTEVENYTTYVPITNTTDSTGKATISIPESYSYDCDSWYEDWYWEPEEKGAKMMDEIRGWVNATYRQRFVSFNDPLLGREESAPYYFFWVRIIDAKPFYQPEKETTIEFRVNKMPPNGTLHVYAYSESNVLLHENVSVTKTEEDIKFSLTFTTPPLPQEKSYTDVQFYFFGGKSKMGKIWVDNIVWEWIFISEQKVSFTRDVIFTVDSLVVGGKTKVTVDDSRFEGYHGFILAGPYVTSLEGFLRGGGERWHSWTEMGIMGYGFPLVETGPGTFSGEFGLPSFWSNEGLEDTREGWVHYFRIVVVFYNPDNDEPLHVGVLDLKPGESGTGGEFDDDDDGGGFLPGFTMPVLVFGVSFVTMVYRRRKKKLHSSFFFK